MEQGLNCVVAAKIRVKYGMCEETILKTLWKDDMESHYLKAYMTVLLYACIHVCM